MEYRTIFLRRTLSFSSLVKLLICGSLLALVSVIYAIIYVSLHDYIKDPVFLEEDKCPACFGRSFCDVLHSGNVTFDSVSRVRLSDYVNTKNVYFAKRNDGTHLVLKKLAFNSELENTDADICQMTSRSPKCDVAKFIYLSKFSKRDIEPRTFTNLSDMVKCPSQRLLMKTLDDYKEKKSQMDLFVEDRLMLGYTLMANPEPILMQAFPARDGWPFPKYYGACGRFVAVEYVGQTLNNYFNSPWEERVDFAYQILKIAELFTNNRPGYNLYMTDVAYDNLAVNKDGKVIIIDLENIIVVDKARILRLKQGQWKEPFYSPFDHCSPSTSCLSFSYDDMCTRLTLDHNYYAVCRNLLSHYASDVLMPKGFLHSLPKDIEDKYHISEMLEECARPVKDNGRFKIVPKLIAALEEIRRDFL